MNIHEETLKHPLSDACGNLGFYDTYSNHLEERDGNLDRAVQQLNVLVNEKLDIEDLADLRGWDIELEGRREINLANIQLTLRKLSEIDKNLGLSCNYSSFYEVG